MTKFTTADADRLLGLADQFMENWEKNQGRGDPECIERRGEWDAIRPLLVQAPALFHTLEAWAFADADRAAAERKGYYEHAREQRDQILRQLGSKAVRR
jgi:hypothetical protein